MKPTLFWLTLGICIIAFAYGNLQILKTTYPTLAAVMWIFGAVTGLLACVEAFKAFGDS